MIDFGGSHKGRPRETRKRRRKEMRLIRKQGKREGGTWIRSLRLVWFRGVSVFITQFSKLITHYSNLTFTQKLQNTCLDS